MNYYELRGVLIRQIDLPDLVEDEAGLDVIRRPGRDSAKCLCPFHGDSDPSFLMTKYEDGWGYKCFGCGETGTAIEFYKKINKIDKTSYALTILCKKLGLENELDILSSIIKESEIDKSIKNSEIPLLISASCRRILREKNDLDTVDWVKKRFVMLNESLESDDKLALSDIYREVTAKSDAIFASESLERYLTYI